jgi:hypothetical protein
MQIRLYPLGEQKCQNCLVIDSPSNFPIDWHPNTLTQAPCDLPLAIIELMRSLGQTRMRVGPCQMKTRVVYEHRRTRQGAGRGQPPPPPKFWKTVEIRAWKC